MKINKDTSAWMNITVTDAEGKDHRFGRMGIQLSGSRSVDSALMKKYLAFQADKLAYDALTVAKKKKATEPVFDLKLKASISFSNQDDDRELLF